MQHTTATKKHAILPLLVLLFLVGGAFFSLNQAKQQQNTNSHAATTNDCTVTAAQLQIKTEEQNLFDLINQYRTQNNIATLTWSDKLKKAAAWMSKDMSASLKLDHKDSLSRDPGIRLADCGFISSTYGENIASGPPAAADIIAAWKASTTHNTLMLSSDYSQGAVAYELDSSGSNAYWSLDMGNAELPQTTITTVPTVPGTITTPTVITPSTTTVPGVTAAATAVPENPDGPTPTPGKTSVNMQIAVKVKIAGLGQDGNQSPVHLSRKIQAFVYGPQDLLISNGNAFLSYDGTNYFTGTINLGKMSEGVYLVKLVSDNSLVSIVKPEFQQLLVERVNQLPPVTLYQGDLTGDNILNLEDYNQALPCFQNKKCETQSIIDFNDDGTTDVKDYNLLLHSFSEYQGN